jgi:hypothetical protein
MTWRLQDKCPNKLVWDLRILESSDWAFAGDETFATPFLAERLNRVVRNIGWIQAVQDKIKIKVDHERIDAIDDLKCD